MVLSSFEVSPLVALKWRDGVTIYKRSGTARIREAGDAEIAGTGSGRAGPT